jgi:hypothetical protein
MNTKLTDEDKIMCSEIIQGYLGGKVPDPITAGKESNIQVSYRSST